MAKATEPDWYLREWATYRGKRQAQLVAELGWHSTTAHRLWHGRQPYRRDFLNEAARWLEIAPFELLLPPPEALALRSIRQSARMIAAEEDGVPFEHAPVRQVRKAGAR
jgi:transcriptional regulator with XRE-family HTH domain